MNGLKGISKLKKKILIPILLILLLCATFFWGEKDLSENQVAENAITEQTPQPSTSPDKTQAPVESEKTPAVTATPDVKPQKTAAENNVDKYKTQPVPEDKPKPVEWQDTTVNKEKKLQCTISVSAKTILNNIKDFNKNKTDILPSDGIIYKSQAVTFSEGESAFDVLKREMQKNKVHLEFEMTPIYNSSYIEGIGNIYELDCGPLSGWMYKVNGWFPNYGSSRYMLKDGDVLEFVYTTDLGRDVGGYVEGGNGNNGR